MVDITPLINNTDFINSTGSVGVIFDGLVNNVAGDITTAITLIILFICVLTLLFRLPLEFSALFIMPLLIVCFAFNVANIGALIVITVLYLAVLVGKNFIVR